MILFSDPEIVDLEEIFKKDFEKRIKEDLADFEVSLRPRFKELRNEFVAGFKKSKEQIEADKIPKLSLNVPGTYLSIDIFTVKDDVAFMKDIFPNGFKFFGMSLGCMIGLLDYNFEYIIDIFELYDDWIKKLGSKPLYFAYFAEKVKEIVPEIEKDIDREEKKLTEPHRGVINTNKKLIDQKRRKLETLKELFNRWDVL